MGKLGKTTVDGVFMGGLLLTISLFSGSTQAGELLMAEFSDYPAFRSIAPQPVEMYAIDPSLPSHARDEIRARLTAGVNFAGTAILAVWGCGSGCITGGIYDTYTANWFEFPFTIHRSLDQADTPFAFQHDSRLLAATGICNEERMGQFYFEWDGQLLAPLDAAGDQCWRGEDTFTTNR